MRSAWRTSLLLLLLLSCSTSRQPADSFDWAIGDWKGTRTSDEGAKVVPMNVRVESLPDGSGQIERMQVNLEPRPYFSVTVRERDRESGRWVMLYTNASRPAIARLEGTIEAEGRIAFRSVTNDPARGSKFVSERLGTDRWRRTQYVSGDGGKSWTVLFVDDLQRQQPPS